jgi:enoyl-CoA hydratase/carnithine racemase
VSDAASEPTIIARREGAAGTLLMNRPKTLNALDLAMIRGFQSALDAWGADPAVALFIVEGAGGKAFCAGGDVRRVREQAIAGDAKAIEAFFAEEYAVNRGIATLQKPWVSLIDGVCMGGGIGVSVHGRPVVVTEAALLAMPETAIALFPDVGTSYVLPKLPGAIGTWLALTGARLRGGDAVAAGLASHYVPKARLPALREALLGGDAAVVERFAEAPPEASFAPHRAAIDRCFGQDSIPAILAALEAEGTDWAAEQVKILRRMSPTSLCVSLELLRRGAGATLDECLAMELALTRSVVNRHPDFREGVRSVLVDKDGTPRWQPATIEAVDPAAIAALFEG